MRKLIPLLAMSLVFTSVLHAADAVKNGRFVQAGDQVTLAANWDLPANSGWSRSADQGPEGAPCLMFNAVKPASGFVRQQLDFATPQTAYVLRVVSRSDGRLAPTIRIVDRHENTEVAPPVVLDTRRDWQARRVEFKSAGADMNLEIYADSSVLQGGKGVAGQVCLASIEITPLAEQKPRQIIPKLGENLALTRPYTMNPKPTYSYCMDPDDKTQLTDGVYTEGHFWTRPTTVGWGGVAPKFINIDLGHDMPIKGVSYSTAAGVAGVNWPQHLYVFVSPDGQMWHKVGDLVPLAVEHDPLPLTGEYANYRFWTDRLQTHGRYVMVVAVSDSYTFVDEIEVFRGDDALMAKAYPDAGMPEVEKYMTQCQTDSLIQQQLTKDLKAVREDVAVLPADKKAAYEPRIAALQQAIATMPSVPMEGFKAILPMLPLEKDIFALQAEVWRAAGKSPLRVWTNHRWDPLEPSQEPPLAQKAPALAVQMVSNEHRAAVVNLTNAGPKPLQVNVRLTGLPGGPNPGFVKVYRVEHVGTRWFDSVAAALPEVTKGANGYAIEVPVGMTRQVWVSFNPLTVKPGTYQGSVEISGGSKLEKVPLALTIHPLRLPEKQTMCLGGWDYTDSPSIYGIKTTNFEPVVKYLKEHGVNFPWAGGAALPFGVFDADGKMSPPPTVRFDHWVKLWPEAKMYAVFVNGGDNCAGEKMGTERFNTMVGNWAHFWAAQMREKGLKPSQLALLIQDEPMTKRQYDIIVAWSKAIKAAEPELKIWEDPQPTEAKDPVAMLEACDIIAPYRGQYLSNLKGWLPGLYEEMRLKGKDISFYNADGPARTFDPYSYYLLQQWHLFANGGSGSCFWAFSDDGGVNNWNEYPAKTNGPYCPYYLDETSITGAKYMEAIREGAQDYEYLTMLSRRVGELEKNGVAPAKLAKAKTLLVEGPRRVLAEETGRIYRWDEPKNRGVQDQVRMEILAALVGLQKL